MTEQKKKLLVRIGLSLLFGSALIGMFELLLRYSNHLWLIIGGIALFTFIYGMIVNEFGFRHPERMLFPLFLVTAVCACMIELLLLSGDTIKHIFIASHAIILGSIAGLFSNYHARTDTSEAKDDNPKAGTKGIEQVRRICYTYIFFLLFHGVFGLFDLLRLYVWAILLGTLVTVVIQLLAFVSQSHTLKLRSLFYILVIALIVTELSWVATLWPIRDVSRAMVVSLSAYSLVGCLLLVEEGLIQKKIVMTHVGFTVVMLALVMTASRWTLSPF